MDWESKFGENVKYGSETPLETLILLAISDGDPDNKTRALIFDENYFYTGVATEMHSVHESGTVVTFSGMDVPDTSYVSPNITVPDSLENYTTYSLWNDEPSSCTDNSTDSGNETSDDGSSNETSEDGSLECVRPFDVEFWKFQN